MKKIREINLPLPVTSVLGISPVLHFTDVFPPTAHEGFSKCVSDDGRLILKDVLKMKLPSAESVEGNLCEIFFIVIFLNWPINFFYRRFFFHSIFKFS